MKIMLDTCVWYNFALIETMEAKNVIKIPKRLKKSKQLWDRLKLMVNSKEIQVITTNWSLLEFRDQMTKLVLEKKFIDSGYSLTDFSEAKKDIPIENTDFDSINRLVFIMPKLCGEDLCDKPINFNLIWRLCNSGISTFDAILVHQASENGCEYFVTRDHDLVDKMKKHELGIKVVHINEFMPKIGIKQKPDKS